MILSDGASAETLPVLESNHQGVDNNTSNHVDAKGVLWVYLDNVLKCRFIDSKFLHLLRSCQ